MSYKSILKSIVSYKLNHDADYKEFIRPGNPNEGSNEHFSIHIRDVLLKASEEYAIKNSKAVSIHDFVRYCLDLLFGRKLSDEEFEAAEYNTFHYLGEASAALKIILAYRLKDMSVFHSTLKSLTAKTKLLDGSSGPISYLDFLGFMVHRGILTNRELLEKYAVFETLVSNEAQQVYLRRVAESILFGHAMPEKISKKVSSETKVQHLTASLKLQIKEQLKGLSKTELQVKLLECLQQK